MDEGVEIAGARFERIEESTVGGLDLCNNSTAIVQQFHQSMRQLLLRASHRTCRDLKCFNCLTHARTEKMLAQAFTEHPGDLLRIKASSNLAGQIGDP